MKKILLLFLITFSNIQAQKLHHQMLSSQGTSKEVSNGFFVSQTIGQQSVIGNYNRQGKIYGQGFQQSFWGKYINSNSSIAINTVTYPNPFVSNINFQFSQAVKETITFSLFDIRGRLILTQEKEATENILSIDLPNLSSSNYLVRLTAPNFLYYTQILKK